jgi:threonine/homoserine/homoserine lactone efflux protein
MLEMQALPIDEIWLLAGILAALGIGVVSPGPSFIMVARTAAAASRADGVAAALGMGAGGFLFGLLALAGLQGLLAAAPALYVALKAAGGLYLAYLGLRMWLGAKQPLAFEAVPARKGRSFVLGFVTQVSNPKTALVYASVFAALLPREFTHAFAAVVLVSVFAVEAGWYALVALALSSERPRAAYLRCKIWADRIAGGALIALGLHLAATAHRG